MFLPISLSVFFLSQRCGCKRVGTPNSKRRVGCYFMKIENIRIHSRKIGNIQYPSIHLFPPENEYRRNNGTIWREL